MFIYPENLKAKPMLWLWLLRDIAVIGIGALLSVLALTQGLGMGLLVVTVLYAFLTIQVDGSSILGQHRTNGLLSTKRHPDHEK